jgi:membrane protease YdiL (CAAX protease family)
MSRVTGFITRGFRFVFLSTSELRLGWTIILYFLIVGASIAIIVGPLIYFLSLIDLPPEPGKPVTGWLSITSSIVTLLTVYFAFLIGTHLAQRWLRKSKLSELGLKIHKKGVNDLLLGIGLGSLIVCLSVFLSWLAGWYQFLGFSWQVRPAAVLLPAFILALVASVQAPLLEEVIFRGFLFQTLHERWGVRTALLISSLLFGIAHLLTPGNLNVWAPVISAFLAGLMFVQAYLVHRTLWIPIGIHFGWIFAGRLLNDVGGSIDKTLLIASTVEGPNLIVTPSGGGAGLFELIGVGLVSLLLWRLSLRKK